MNAMRSPRSIIRVVYLLTLSGSLIWLGGIFLAPYLESRRSALTAFIYAVYAPLCHQIPSRSFACFGHPLAVCGRCLGIYLGFLLGVGLYAVLRGFLEARLPKTEIFITMSLPIVLDTAANFFHLWMSPNWFRLVLGLIWGTTLPFYFITGLAELGQQIRVSRQSGVVS
jgi:uncharacterized membrane protein